MTDKSEKVIDEETEKQVFAHIPKTGKGVHAPTTISKLNESAKGLGPVQIIHEG